MPMLVGTPLKPSLHDLLLLFSRHVCVCLCVCLRCGIVVASDSKGNLRTSIGEDQIFDIIPLIGLANRITQPSSSSTSSSSSSSSSHVPKTSAAHTKLSRSPQEIPSTPATRESQWFAIKKIEHYVRQSLFMHTPITFN